jgi:hypothetical protein
LSSFLTALGAKGSTELLAESSELAKAVSRLAKGVWSGAAPLADGRRLLLPGTLLPAYSYDPSVGQLKPASYGIELVLCAALLTLLWALVAVVVVPPTLVGLLVSICTRTLAQLFLLDLLSRAAAETQCALSLMGTHLGTSHGSDASGGGGGDSDLSPTAVHAAILDQLLGLVLDEMGCPAEGRAGGAGVEPYPYFSVFASFSHAARLAALQRRVSTMTGAQVRASVGAALSRNPLSSGPDAEALQLQPRHGPW